MRTRLLADPLELARRQDASRAPHVAPLNGWAETLRGGGRFAPLFDPADGGVNARVLLLLESPGPGVRRTGFVSSDNPSATAENLLCLRLLAGLPRAQVAVWNSVPWLLSETGIKTPQLADLQEAVPATLALLDLLPRLKVVVLVGRVAERAWKLLPEEARAQYSALPCPHPSPNNLRARPEASVELLRALLTARALSRD